MSSNAVKTVTVYCGSRTGHDPKWMSMASECGAALAQNGIAMVFGGGRNGLMGASARAALDAGGKVTGIIPETLLAVEPAMEDLTELFVVDSMHTRKLLMSEKADAFLVLPGGIGTFEEFFEIWTWFQIGLHKKPIVLLNAHDYYSPLLRFLQHAVDLGFFGAHHHMHLRVAKTARDAVSLLQSPAEA
jgi:uncharacterized protein (TIGR00730 family)